MPLGSEMNVIHMSGTLVPLSSTSIGGRSNDGPVLGQVGVRGSGIVDTQRGTEDAGVVRLGVVMPVARRIAPLDEADLERFVGQSQAGRVADCVVGRAAGGADVAGRASLQQLEAEHLVEGERLVEVGDRDA